MVVVNVYRVEDSMGDTMGYRKDKVTDSIRAPLDIEGDMLVGSMGVTVAFRKDKVVSSIRAVVGLN